MQEMYAAEGIKTVCLVPLVSNNRAVGLLGLYHARDHEWPEDELALAQSFANQAAVAISNARLYRSVADQAARIRSIQDLSARLNRLTDVQAIADAIVAEASTLAAYHDIRVYTVDWERGVCEPIAFTDRLLGDGDFREALRVTIGEGSFTGWVAEHGEPILANDALNDTRGHTIEGTDDIEESMLVVPMLFEGRSVGVIALSKLGNNQFSNDDLQTMTIFAGYAAQAMANAGAYERLELQSAELARQLQSQRRLLEINERLLSTLDRADVLETIADGLKAVVRYDNLSIYGVDEAQRVLVPVLTRERHEEEVRALHRAIRAGADGMGGRARGAGAGQRRAHRPARHADPGHAGRPGGAGGGPADGRWRRHRLHEHLAHRRPGDLLQRRRLRAGQAVRRPGLDRPAQRRRPPGDRHARRDRRADRTGQPRRLPAHPGRRARPAGGRNGGGPAPRRAAEPDRWRC